MTNREDRTQALAEASAREHDVDRLEPEIDAASRHGRGWSRRRLAVAAAGAVTLGVVGATVWASDWGGPTTPVPAASSSSVVSTSPTPQISTTALPTSSAASGPMIPTTAPSASTSPARPDLSTRSVLVAADYGLAGWPLDSVEATKGWGQSPIATCQFGIPEPADTRPVFRGDGYRRAEGRVLAAYQLVIDAGTTRGAENVVTTVLTWPGGCDSRLGRAGFEEYVITSTPPERLTLPDGSVGYWYTTNIQDSRPDRVELVVMAQRAERVSLVVLHENEPAGSLDAVDAGELLERSLERLA